MNTKHGVIKLLLLTMLLGICNPTIGQEFTPPFGVRAEKGKILEAVLEQIDAAQYDSAETIITQQLIDHGARLNKYELYFLHSYEAEIMYYNALYDQGIVSALKAKELGKELKNDTLVGNALNLIGLQYLQTKQYTKAKSSFKEALLRLPERTDMLFYSQCYQVLANLAELYLYEVNADSAIYFSNLAIEKAHLKGTPRGESLAYWSLAEGELIAGRPIEAREAVKRANAIMLGIEEEDVSLYFAITNAKIYAVLNVPDSVEHYIQNGLKMIESETETDQAKVTFLEFLTDFSIKNNDLIHGSVALKRLSEERNKIYFKQNEVRLNLLNNFYRGKEELIRANILHEAQAKQISLRTVLASALGACILILMFALIASYRNFKHKRHIAELKHQNELRDKQKKMEIKSLEDNFIALNAERNRIGSDLHDDIGAGLSSIHIYSTLFSTEGETKMNTSLVEKINKVSAGLLDRMSDIIWSINSENRTIRDLLLRVKSFANELLPALDITLNYTIEKKLEEIILTDLARKNLYLTFKEALNNIAKHSQAREVDFQFFKENGNLRSTISDDGSGFDNDKNTLGHGLKTMASRIEKLGGTFNIDSQLQTGTKIDISIPFSNIIEKLPTEFQPHNS